MIKFNFSGINFQLIHRPSTKRDIENRIYNTLSKCKDNEIIELFEKNYFGSGFKAEWDKRFNWELSRLINKAIFEKIIEISIKKNILVILLKAFNHSFINKEQIQLILNNAIKNKSYDFFNVLDVNEKILDLMNTRFNDNFSKCNFDIDSVYNSIDEKLILCVSRFISDKHLRLEIFRNYIIKNKLYIIGDKLLAQWDLYHYCSSLIRDCIKLGDDFFVKQLLHHVYKTKEKDRDISELILYSIKINNIEMYSLLNENINSDYYDGQVLNELLLNFSFYDKNLNEIDKITIENLIYNYNYKEANSNIINHLIKSGMNKCNYYYETPILKFIGNDHVILSDFYRNLINKYFSYNDAFELIKFIKANSISINNDYNNYDYQKEIILLIENLRYKDAYVLISKKTSASNSVVYPSDGYHEPYQDWHEGAIVDVGLVKNCRVVERKDDPMHFYLKTSRGKHITFFPYKGVRKGWTDFT